MPKNTVKPEPEPTEPFEMKMTQETKDYLDVELKTTQMFVDDKDYEGASTQIRTLITKIRGANSYTCELIEE